MVSEGRDDRQHNGRLWRAMQSMKIQPQGESIHALLDEVTKRRISVGDLWIEVKSIILFVHVRY